MWSPVCRVVGLRLPLGCGACLPLREEKVVCALSCSLERVSKTLVGVWKMCAVERERIAVDVLSRPSEHISQALEKRRRLADAKRKCIGRCPLRHIKAHTSTSPSKKKKSTPLHPREKPADHFQTSPTTNPVASAFTCSDSNAARSLLRATNCAPWTPRFSASLSTRQASS
jgi:hypothetical protein